jgi:hypothetical protein
MASEKIELFVILLKLKSFLVGMLDDPSVETGGLELTGEYLDRKYPERKEEVLDLLSDNNLVSDSQIAFGENVQQKFREIISGLDMTHSLREMLDKFRISADDISASEKTLEEIKQSREQKLKEIVSLLLQLARIWTMRNELENNIEDFSLLDEEELIRPDELKELDKLDEATSSSYATISKLTEIYLEQFADYYFRFGGDIPLNDFIGNLDKLKKKVLSGYRDLYRNLGAEPGKES